MESHSTTISVISRRQVESHGLTLFELLIVLAVVLAIGALALPFTLREYQRRESVAFRDRIAMQALMARAQARVEGVPYVMAIDESGTRIQVFSLDPRDPGSAFQSEESSEVPDVITEENAPPVLEPWQVVVLPGGTFFESELPMDWSDEPADDFAAIEQSPQVGEGQARPLASMQLAVFLPDGTLLGAAQVVLNAPSGKFLLVFDGWTGRLTMERILTESEPVS